AVAMRKAADREQADNRAIVRQDVQSSGANHRHTVQKAGLDALGPTYMELAAQTGIEPGLLHRVAVIGSGTLDILPHNGAVVSLLAICGLTHRDSYLDIVMVGIMNSVIALIAV
ncbi:MAG: hypothetical protein ACK463_16985, partial [Bradyrhizobium sp.]